MREIVKDGGKYWIKESNIIEEATLDSLSDAIATLTLEKEAYLAQQAGSFDERIAELNALITQLQAMQS